MTEICPISNCGKVMFEDFDKSTNTMIVFTCQFHPQIHKSKRQISTKVRDE